MVKLVILIPSPFSAGALRLYRCGATVIKLFQINYRSYVQKRAARIVTSSVIYDTNVGDLFIKLERRKLRTQRQMQKAESLCMVLHWSISQCTIYQPWWHNWIFLERLHQQRCSSISSQHFFFINSFSFSGAVHWLTPRFAARRITKRFLASSTLLYSLSMWLHGFIM